MRKLKGIIKYAHLRKMLYSDHYKNHTLENGIYRIEMTKSIFEVIPKSIKFYKVYQVK